MPWTFQKLGQGLGVQLNCGDNMPPVQTYFRLSLISNRYFIDFQPLRFSQCKDKVQFDIY